MIGLPLLMVLIAQPAIGSVSTAGRVELRGVPTSAGTVFAGDRISVGRDAHAKVWLHSGARFQLGAGTNVTIRGNAKKANVRMEAGNVAFTAESAQEVRVQIQTGNYEMTAEPQSAGNVVFSGPEAFGVRVIRGAVRIRNAKTQESFVVRQGFERLILMAGHPSAPPHAVPAFPSPAQSSTRGMSTRAWIASGILGGTAAAIAILISKNDDRPGDAEGRFAKALEEAALKAKVLDHLGLMASQGAQVTIAASAVANTATAARAAIDAAPVSAAIKTALRNNANAIIAQATALLPQRATVDAEALALKTTIQSQRGTPTDAQLLTLNVLTAQSASLIAQAKFVFQSLSSLLEQARQAGVPNLPPPPPVDLPPGPEIALPPPVPLPDPVPASASKP